MHVYEVLAHVACAAGCHVPYQCHRKLLFWQISSCAPLRVFMAPGHKQRNVKGQAPSRSELKKLVHYLILLHHSSTHNFLQS